ncbi:hypothetical protein ACHQM5_007336 [Ranunculus cassubicifolius]
MALRKYVASGHASSLSMAPLNFANEVHEKAQFVEPETAPGPVVEDDVDIDLSEVYFLIMHFLSAGPCHRTYGQFWNELLEHQLLPRRYHAWYSRSGAHTGDENDNGYSFPLSYNKLVERYPHIDKDHLVKLLKQLILRTAPPLHGMAGGNAPNAADVSTLLGSGSFSLLGSDRNIETKQAEHPPIYLRWPHMKADPVRGLSLREIGGGFSKHHRAPSIRGACYAIAKPSTMVQRMQNIKKLRGHRDAVYCAIFDRSGRYVITGSDDRLVKIWSMETAFCLATCRGHEGDITDLAVSSNNAWVASSSNDFIIRVWRLPDGVPIAVLRGHTAAVTAIAFSPRPTTPSHILSSSDDGTCRIWDIRHTQTSPRVYIPKPLDGVNGKGTVPSSSLGPSSSAGPQSHQILCCAYNANGTVFVTGSSDTFARVWNACKSNTDDPEQPHHELDVLCGHEHDVNYVQFSGCAVPSRFSIAESSNEENIPKFKNSWFTRDNIVTCSRDGSAIIWVPKSRRSHSKVGRWSRAYHLKVPPPPMPIQPLRGGPRQRSPVTPRGVNMIVWSLDNRFVLAAIMDCRICVWNAVDGSLVHSLNGHSESTYVLDVHPFNPRVAMSAGYDGKTIVWDIWEGIPIRTYEIGRFKLIDGKFSPDGTSIILSDDVGQIYILNTGQGESQKDAKYDQFFLGDYRALIQDTNGYVLDQETQLAPHLRNFQDLLCDSSMIPYPEPYQSMYQQRRLGALGIERRYSAANFSVGTVDINSVQDYQMLPLPDLDTIIEPLPAFIDIMDWEPEIEIQSDDNDSEYNVTDEFASEGERGSLGTRSDNSQGSAEDSEAEDGLRRSRRKKHKAEVMTSSGRRVKRRNLDDCDGVSSRSNRTRKSSKGKKSSKRKSTSKSMRPQRVAARNARHWFSRINGAGSEEEDVDTSEDELLSDSESMLDESDIQSNESDQSIQDLQPKDQKGKGVSLDELQPQPNARNTKRFILKLPVRDSKITRPVEEENRDKFGADRNHLSSQEPGSSSSKFIDPVLNEGQAMVAVREQSEKVEDHLGLSTGYHNNKIKWGEVKARTSKRLRFGDANLRFHANTNHVNGHFKLESDPESQSNVDETRPKREGSLQERTMKYEAHYGPSESRAYDESLEVVDSDGPMVNGTSRSTKLRFIHRARPEEPESSLKAQSIPPSSDSISSGCQIEGNAADNGDQKRSGDSTISEIHNVSRTSILQRQDSNNRMYNAVYKRSKTSSRAATLENDGVNMEEPILDTSTNNNNHHEPKTESPEATADGVRRTRSMIMKATTTREPDHHNLRKREGRNSNNNNNRCEELLSGSWGPNNSRARVGLRSARNKSDTYIKRNQHQSLKKLSWLMLSEPEDNHRYIPQLGDRVAYLRQGHEGFIEYCGLKEKGPWTKFASLRAVEFCKVEDLVYSQVSGSGESCCKITLEFVDPSSSGFGQTFRLTWPELNDFSDFLVEKTQYDASIDRNWTKRDKCQVWWRNADGEGGTWYDGRITAVEPASPEYPDSPWERYVIQYKSDADQHLHSPWELRDPDIAWDHPHIDDEMRNLLLSYMEKLEHHGGRSQDRYGIQKLEQVSGKSDFLNRFPVPLTLEVIQSRLENNYYRSVDAVKHDFRVMLENAQKYFITNEEVIKVKLRRLSDWFNEKLMPL